MAYIIGEFAEKFTDAHKKFGYAITSSWNAIIRTGVPLEEDIPVAESLQFLITFNNYFMGLEAGSLETPVAVANPAVI